MTDGCARSTPMTFVISVGAQLAQRQDMFGESAGTNRVHEPHVGSDERLLQHLRQGE